MKLAGLPVAFVLLGLISFGCSDSDDEHDHETGDGGDDGAGGEGGTHGEADKCCELGAICHVVGDDVDPEVQACHELGHENDEAACAAEYESCLSICQGVTDAPVEHACE